MKINSDQSVESHVREGLVYVFEEESRVLAYVVILVASDAVELTISTSQVSIKGGG